MTEPPTWTRKRPFRLGLWRIDPDLNQIARPGEERRVEPRVMEVLLCLAARPQSVVSRDEILESVWCDAVVGEEALTRAISELRRALGDDTRAPRFIETIHKGGYRLLVRPEPVEAEAANRERARRGPTRRTVWVISAVVIAILAFIGLNRDRWPRGNTGSPMQILDATPLTAYQGSEEYPAISPDGSHVAFAWDGEDESNTDIYVLQIGSESTLRLTEDPGIDRYPRWSADGRTLIYVHREESGQSIREVPLIGGQPRVVIRSHGWLGGVDESPDGSSIVFAEGDMQGNPAGLVVHDLEAGTRRPLIDRPSDGVGDIAPAYSPDGGAVAFIRIDGAGLMDIYLAPTNGSKARRLTQGLLQVRGVDWTRDGRSVICSAVSSAYYALWRIDVSDGRMRRVPTRGEWTHYPSVARRADRLVYQDIWFDKNIWRVQRHDDGVLGLSTDALITSTRWDCEASYSPDGKRIAFTSARSGDLEVWTAAADGSQLLQLTRFARLNVGNPRWSPDGRKVAFNASEEGFPDLWVVRAVGGRPERITDCGHKHILTSWSRDGEWLYFGSDRGGTWELWKRRIEHPDGTEIQVTEGGGISGFESPDGERLYFARADRPGLWRIPVGVKGTPVPETVLENLPGRGDWGNWSMTNDGIVLARRGKDGPVIVFYDFATGALREITRVPSIAVPSLTASPDGMSFLYARIDRRVSDVMMIDGFR